MRRPSQSWPSPQLDASGVARIEKYSPCIASRYDRHDLMSVSKWFVNFLICCRAMSKKRGQSACLLQISHRCRIDAHEASRLLAQEGAGGLGEQTDEIHARHTGWLGENRARSHRKVAPRGALGCPPRRARRHALQPRAGRGGGAPRSLSARSLIRPDTERSASISTDDSPEAFAARHRWTRDFFCTYGAIVHCDHVTGAY